MYVYLGIVVPLLSVLLLAFDDVSLKTCTRWTLSAVIIWQAERQLRAQCNFNISHLTLNSFMPDKGQMGTRSAPGQGQIRPRTGLEQV